MTRAFKIIIIIIVVLKQITHTRISSEDKIHNRTVFAIISSSLDSYENATHCLHRASSPAVSTVLNEY